MDERLPPSIGWYGKLPSRGDFVGSGLPRAWLRTWDEWLQRAMAQAAQRLGAQTLRERLAAMSAWQGLVRTGQPPSSTWCAVVVASSDRVGRVFPLLIAEAFDATALDPVALANLQARARDLLAWLEVARAEASPREFEAGLARHASTPWHAAVSGAETSAEDVVAALWARWPAAASLWWGLAPADEPVAPLAEDWPPRDDLLLDWLGA